MNNIMVRTDAGDTVDISTMDTDPAKVPGVLIDDSVRVVCAGKDVDGVKVLTAQELTVTVHSPYYYIQGTWLEPNPIKASEMQGVTLEADGSAVSVGMATLQFKNWSLADGKVMLTAESIGNGVNAETTRYAAGGQTRCRLARTGAERPGGVAFRAEKVSFSPD